MLMDSFCVARPALLRSELSSFSARVSRLSGQGSRMSLVWLLRVSIPPRLVVPGQEKPRPASPGTDEEGAWPQTASLIGWFGSNGASCGASPPGAAGLENKRRVDPQNIMGVLGLQSNRLPLHRHQSVCLRLAQEGRHIWDPGCKA